MFYHLLVMYNRSGIDFLVELFHKSKGIKEFEKNNKDIAINVFYATEKENSLSLVYKSKHKDRKDNIDLLVIGEDDSSHYTVTKNLSRLMNK